MKILFSFLIFLLLFSISFTIYSLYQNQPRAIYFGCSLEQPITVEKIAQIKNEMELTNGLQIVEFYFSWPFADHADAIKSQLDEIGTTLDTLWSLGILPCFTWEPQTSNATKPLTIEAEEILRGNYDAYIEKVAQILRDRKKPLILRFAHEMNLDHYHWGLKEYRFDQNAPETYKKMYRYIHHLFEKVGAENVLWAFCINVDSVPNEDWNHAKNYYPGRDYVDILGMDGYNWEDSFKGWKTFDEIFHDAFHTLKDLDKYKPIIVFETASVGNRRDKKEWLHGALTFASRWRLQGLVWFNIDKEREWKIADLSRLAPSMKTEPTAIEWASSLIDTR